MTTISDSPAIMATVSEWVLCTTYHIWRQHLCSDYNQWFPSMATVSEWVLCTTYYIWRQHLCSDYNQWFPSMATVSEWVLCTTYHIWRQHLCCDYNKWFPSHHGDSQRVSPLYHLPHMTPASLLWLQLVITQPSLRQAASESSVPLTTYGTSISVVTTISHYPAIMATVSEWVLCITYHIWRQHLCCDYNHVFPSPQCDSQRVSPLYHLPHMTPASLLWLQPCIPQPSRRQSASESSVSLTTYDASISVVTTTMYSPAIMAAVSEWVLCTVALQVCQKNGTRAWCKQQTAAYCSSFTRYIDVIINALISSPM